MKTILGSLAAAMLCATALADPITLVSDLRYVSTYDTVSFYYGEHDFTNSVTNSRISYPESPFGIFHGYDEDIARILAYYHRDSGVLANSYVQLESGFEAGRIWAAANSLVWLDGFAEYPGDSCSGRATANAYFGVLFHVDQPIRITLSGYYVGDHNADQGVKLSRGDNTLFTGVGGFAYSDLLGRGDYSLIADSSLEELDLFDGRNISYDWEFRYRGPVSDAFPSFGLLGLSVGLLALLHRLWRPAGAARSGFCVLGCWRSIRPSLSAFNPKP